MSVVDLVAGALRLDPEAFAAIVTRDDALGVAAVVLIAGGLSHATGQSVVLFANRVRPRRFLLSLAVAAGLFAGSVLAWAAALDLSAGWIAGARAPIRDVIAVVGLAHAPRLLGLFVLVPYFGSGGAVALTVWTFLATAVGARAVFGFSLPQALLVLGATWLLTETVTRTIGRPVVGAARRLRTWSEGPTNPRAS